MRLGSTWKSRPAADIAAAVRVLGGDPAPSWTESVILAAFAATSAGPASKQNDFHLLGMLGRPLRVVLADRLRQANLTTWPAVLSAATADWNLATMQTLARSQARADAAIHYLMEATEGKGDDAAEPFEPTPAPSLAQPAATPPAAADGEMNAAERLIEEAVAEIVEWRNRGDRALKSARTEQARLESRLKTLASERDTLAERIAAYEAVAEDATSTAPPTDTFVGRRVLVFTGAANADARVAFAQSFRDLSATEVDCYWAERSRGPDQFPADAIVAIDLTFMSHSTSSAIQERARAAGVWCYWGKHGSATLSRATAAAWTIHRVRQ